MWDLIVSVPDHCLSFYFFKIPNISYKDYVANDEDPGRNSSA